MPVCVLGAGDPSLMKASHTRNELVVKIEDRELKGLQ